MHATLFFARRRAAQRFVFGLGLAQPTLRTKLQSASLLTLARNTVADTSVVGLSEQAGFGGSEGVRGFVLGFLACTLSVGRPLARGAQTNGGGVYGGTGSTITVANASVVANNTAEVGGPWRGGGLGAIR